MANATELFRQGKTREIWQKYCGFIDLSIDEFMEIQERLLMEQIDLLSKCELGRKIMGDKIPKSVEEFRRNVPLTTYDYYAPYLSKKREDVLPEKPYVWCHTSGKTGQHKWVPHTKRMYKAMGETLLASLILATSKKRGDFSLEERDCAFYCVAPPPYISGVGYRALSEELNLTFIPPLERAEKMDFAGRIQEGFRLSLIRGMDVFVGASSVLASIGRRFAGEDDGVLGEMEKTEHSEEHLDNVEAQRFKVLTQLPTRGGEECSMCLICEESCPVGAMDAESGEADSGKCIACLACVANCPDSILKINDMRNIWSVKLEMEKATEESLKGQKSRIYY